MRLMAAAALGLAILCPSQAKADPRLKGTINDTAEGAPFSAALASWLDLDKFLTHIAVENALAETDGVLGSQGMNNFYLYQYGGARRFVFIPWDKDSSFSNPSFPLFSRVDTNVLTRKLLADPAQNQKYQDLVKRTVNEVLNPAVIGGKGQNFLFPIKPEQLSRMM